MVTLAPSLASLDPFHAASAALVNKTIMLRVRGFGWCGGKLIETVPKRNRKIDGAGQISRQVRRRRVPMRPTVALEAKDYDTSAEADFESWMLLEPEAEEQQPAEA